MRKIVLIAALSLLFSKNYCQTKDSIPKIIFGFNVGLNYSNSQLKNTPSNVQSTNAAGFRMGILMDCRLNDHFSFSPKAEMSFNDSKVTILKNPDTKDVYNVYPVLMEFAAHVTYHLFDKKMQPYILFGPSFKVPLTGDKKINYATQRSGIALDLGVGLDRKLKYFNIAPELRYSYGLTDLSDKNLDGQLYYHNIALVLNFKG